jgi:hypothetical protein
MNRPFDSIHCIDWGYGRLLFPWFGGWVCWRTALVGGGEFLHPPRVRGQFRLAPFGRFHNCRITGVF